MKTPRAFIRVFAFASLFFLCTSIAYATESDQIKAKQQLKDVISQQRIIENFNKINIHGRAQVEYIATRENEHKLEIDAPRNLLRYVKSEIDLDQLNIKIDHSGITKVQVLIRIFAPEIDAISLNGEIDFRTNDSRLRGEVLDIESLGTVNITADLDVHDLQARLKGFGKINLSGRANVQTISAQGNLNIQADKLSGEVGELELLGDGNCSLNLSESLDIIIKGAGSVTYIGSPSVENQIIGAGAINKI